MSVEDPRSDNLSRSLAGKVFIVTGAAAGLGRAYSSHLLTLGAAVVATDIDGAALAALSHDDGGSALELSQADVTDRGVAETLVDDAVMRFGRLDGIVANAGVLRSGPLLSLSDDDLDLVLHTHVTASFRLLRAAERFWRQEFKANRGAPASAVLTTSAAGLYGLRGEAAYSAAKAAVAMLTAVAADELGRYGVTVNAIAPGARTQMTAWMGDTDLPVSRDPLAAEHVAPVVAWLLSDAARNVTGRVIEAGNGTVSIPSGWTPGESVELPLLASPSDMEKVMTELIAKTPPDRPITTVTEYQAS